MLVVETIDNIEEFTRIRDHWDAAYDADPQAQYFLSWLWLSKWFRRLSGPWFILAARQEGSSDYVGFFPLRLRTKEKRGGGFYNEINMAGNYVADYTGFICAATFEEEVIKSFALHLRKLHWTNMHLENIRMSEDRLQRLLSHFPARMFEMRDIPRINPDSTNNCICPQLELPDNWERYLESLPSSNMRQKIRRFLRQLDAAGDLRITLADEATVDRDIELLLGLWETRWTKRKGDRIKMLVENNRNMLHDVAATGSLFLPVLWQGEKPLGALGSLIDRRKRSLLFFVAGRDETVSTPPPGVILHAYSIRHAIGEGLLTYDFLRGNEPYKYTFGASDRVIKCIDVSTTDRRNLGGRIDRRSIPMVMQRAANHCKAQKLVEAAAAFQQVLDADPQCANALYGLGQIRAAQGKHGAARRLFKALVAIEPNAERAWLKLGKSLDSNQRFADAADAYREAIGVNPDNAEAHNKLGNSLYRLRRFDEALAAFEKALAVRPGYLEAAVSRVNLLHALGRMPASEAEHCARLNAKLGDLISAKGNGDFAVSCYRQAIRLKPDLLDAHRSLARIMLAKGDSAGAIASLNSILEVDPDDAEACAMLGKLTRGDAASSTTAPVQQSERATETVIAAGG
jgi:tetratricopeptide (TPR) repeat protein